MLQRLIIFFGYLKLAYSPPSRYYAEREGRRLIIFVVNPQVYVYENYHQDIDLPNHFCHNRHPDTGSDYGNPIDLYFEGKAGLV